jgi:hypothetical protein
MFNVFAFEQTIKNLAQTQKNDIAKIMCVNPIAK